MPILSAELRDRKESAPKTYAAQKYQRVRVRHTMHVLHRCFFLLKTEPYEVLGSR